MSKDDFDRSSDGRPQLKPPVPRLDIPTNRELKAIIRRQAGLLEQPALRYDPPWLMDANDPVRKQLREVSRRRTRLTNRLDKAVKKLENDFDLSS